MILIRRVLFLAALLAAGCRPAADPPRAPETAEADKAVTRAAAEEDRGGGAPGIPFMYYSRSTNTLGLSWRVGLLPHIGEQALYERFKLDEPWDSEHNKPLIEKMPEVLKSPRGNAPAGHTYYRAFLSRPVPKEPRRPFFHTAYQPPMTPERVKALYTNGSFRPGQPVMLAPEAQVIDGTINTLFFAEAAEAVPWTKPDELVYDEADPLPKLGGVYGDGFFAVSVAGAVAFVPRETAEKTIRALISSNGGETITDKGLVDQLNAPFPAKPGPPAKPGKP